MGGGEWEEEGGGDLRGVELVGGCFPWCFFCGGLFPLLLGGGLLEGSGLLVGGGLRFVFVCGGLFLPVMTDPVPVPTSSGGGGKGGGRGGGGDGGWSVDPGGGCLFTPFFGGGDVGVGGGDGGRSSLLSCGGGFPLGPARCKCRSREEGGSQVYGAHRRMGFHSCMGAHRCMGLTGIWGLIDEWSSTTVWGLTGEWGLTGIWGLIGVWGLTGVWGTCYSIYTSLHTPPRTLLFSIRAEAGAE